MSEGKKEIWKLALLSESLDFGDAFRAPVVDTFDYNSLRTTMVAKTGKMRTPTVTRRLYSPRSEDYQATLLAFLFISHLQPRLRRFLEAKDPPALVILA